MIPDEKNDKEKEIFSFAIRFCAWSAVFFSDESMGGTCNGSFIQ